MRCTDSSGRSGSGGIRFQIMGTGTAVGPDSSRHGDTVVLKPDYPAHLLKEWPSRGHAPMVASGLGDADIVTPGGGP